MSIEATITDTPDGTVSFAIILDDLDVPWKKEYNHWIIYYVYQATPYDVEAIGNKN